MCWIYFGMRGHWSARDQLRPCQPLILAKLHSIRAHVTRRSTPVARADLEICQVADPDATPSPAPGTQRAPSRDAIAIIGAVTNWIFRVRWISRVHIRISSGNAHTNRGRGES
jgi:hypothetical protein